jgi:hypothetical protein
MTLLDSSVRRTTRGAKNLTLLIRKRLLDLKLIWVRHELRVTDKREKKIEHRKKKKRIQQEIFQLENAIRAAQEEQYSKGTLLDLPQPLQEEAAGESGTGALPDFLVVGGKKCGTTFLYDLLSRHPYVQTAAKKELHFFDIVLEEEGIEWYRRCFPKARWKDGRRTITGEATPYLGDASVPKKVAKVLPSVRLIILLRNPVERAYSDYQQARRKGREHLTFEDAIEAAMTQTEARRGYLSRSIYVDQLLRWSRFFSQEQMLVLKSEDLFERTQDTFKHIQDFLNLPYWEPETWEPETSEVRNTGAYEQGMHSATRRRLEEFFKPHNERLYEYFGVDLDGVAIE